MSTVNLSELFPENKIRLSIPDGVERLSIRNAAQAYAESGWYVLPVASNSKNPGSYVGKGWPDKSTRDPAQIDVMFSDRDLSIALHIGKSGALVIDVDDPSELPDLLNDELQESNVPFQASRMIGDPRRGHYFFSLPSGAMYGNGVGSLGDRWGDVRGNNGVVIAAPSIHASGGHYSWKRTGELPELPTLIAWNLNPSKDVNLPAASTHETSDFMKKHTGNLHANLLAWRIHQLKKDLKVASSRHTAFLTFVLTILKDSKLDFYDASNALNQAHSIFNFTKPIEEQTSNEFDGIVAWALAQVEAMTLDQLALHGFLTAPELDEQILDWIACNGWKL